MRKRIDMARLYANENFPLPVVIHLRQRGHDVLTVHETGKSEQAWPDEDVLEYASHDDRAILTFNRRHFMRLHQTLPDHAGIIVCSVDPNFEALATRIDQTLVKFVTLQGMLIRINRGP
jgi:hypothetical protein